MEHIGKTYLETLDSIKKYRKGIDELLKKKRLLEEKFYDYMSKKGLDKYKLTDDRSITIASVTPAEIKKQKRVATQELKKQRIAKMLEEKGIEEAESILNEVLEEMKKRS